MSDVIKLTQNLIQCQSVTPKDDGAQDILASLLKDAGFECYHLPFGEGDERIENLFARIGTGSPHICFAGHTDVVPTGDEKKWTHPPFSGVIEDGMLYGRGASDMKGMVAAFVSAALSYISEHGAPEVGSISFLITGDEEADAIKGTVKVLEWMKEHGHIPDFTLVGEPTNPDHLGQEIKIGRRGSLTGDLYIKGKQGHVAYQHLADNPLPRLAAVVSALSSYEFDQGNDHFAPTNLEVTTIDVGNSVDNVIPEKGYVQFNTRYNDQWNAETLEAKIREIVESVGGEYELSFWRSAESFMTAPGKWSQIVQDAVESVTGKKPALTTTGGTSDARFISQYCPVVECGGVNKTIHQIDECARVSDLEQLTLIYKDVLNRFFS